MYQIFSLYICREENQPGFVDDELEYSIKHLFDIICEFAFYELMFPLFQFEGYDNYWYTGSDKHKWEIHFFYIF